MQPTKWWWTRRNRWKRIITTLSKRLPPRAPRLVLRPGPQSRDKASAASVASALERWQGVVRVREALKKVRAPLERAGLRARIATDIYS
jgi:hypothetical protein